MIKRTIAKPIQNRLRRRHNSLLETLCIPALLRETSLAVPLGLIRVALGNLDTVVGRNGLLEDMLCVFVGKD
jgi:hypothetical protein